MSEQKIKNDVALPALEPSVSCGESVESHLATLSDVMRMFSFQCAQTFEALTIYVEITRLMHGHPESDQAAIQAKARDVYAQVVEVYQKLRTTQQQGYVPSDADKRQQIPDDTFIRLVPGSKLKH